MNESILQFADVARRFVQRSGYTSGQLARLSGVPQMTIVNWLQGRVKRPRAWQDVVKLARALRLTQGEANDLLAAAGYPPLPRLQAQAQNEEEQMLSAFWREEKTSSDRQAPFQAIRDLPTFTGREAILQTLYASLMQDRHDSIYVLAGAAGVGKTAVAARLAYRLRDHFPDGVLWLRADNTPVMTALHLFADAYGQGACSYDDVDSRSAFVRQMLARKRALLVLDNVCRSREVEPLLPPTGSCAVLLTTRQRNLQLAHGADYFHLEPFLQDEALSLFTRVLGEAAMAADQATFLQIAGLLGYLPLAIDIAACRLAYEPGWRASDFLAQLRHEHHRINLVEYEDRSLWLVLEESFVRLPPAEQRFFAALSVFEGIEFSATAAAKASNVPVTVAEKQLRTLFGLCFVRRGVANGRYRLIPLLQTFAAGQWVQEIAYSMT